jgi:hypothetical protein
VERDVPWSFSTEADPSSGQTTSANISCSRHKGSTVPKYAESRMVALIQSVHRRFCSQFHVMSPRRPTFAPSTDAWKRAYNDAICEIELSIREKKIQIARREILHEIENAIHAGHSHPHIKELKIALSVLDVLLCPPPPRKNFRN